MDGTWDLSILYQGSTTLKYAADLEKLEQSVDTFCRRIDAIAASQERMSAGQLAELLKMQEEIIVLRDDLQKYAVLRRETNAGEEAAAKYNGLVAKIYSMASGADTLLLPLDWRNRANGRRLQEFSYPRRLPVLYCPTKEKKQSSDAGRGGSPFSANTILCRQCMD